MSDEKKKLLMFLRGLSEKGQGIVEFGVVVAFCVAIGYFMQTVGFASALNENHLRQRKDTHLFYDTPHSISMVDVLRKGSQHVLSICHRGLLF